MILDTRAQCPEVGDEPKRKGKYMNTTQETISDLYRRDPLAACRRALRETQQTDWKTRLEAIDTLLGNHGTEAIRGEWQNGYWCDIAAAYSNTGDTYALTVIHVRGDGWNPQGRFIISSWGDWFEKNERKLALV